MTPPAATVAGRSETKRREAEQSERTAAGNGQRGGRGPTTAPRPPRRVSGPSADAAFAAEARGLTAAAARAGARAAQTPRAKAGGAPAARPRAGAAAAPPRSRPRAAAAAPAAKPRTARTAHAGAATAALPIEIQTRTRPERSRRQAAAAPRRPLHHRALRGIVGLPDHRLLDRIVRGRAWIPVLGILLATIVGMRVEVLKLGASVGRSVSLASALQSRNELLRESVSMLSSDQRIESLAARWGMVMPNPANVHFVSARAVNAKQAAEAITAPDPAAYRASVVKEETTDPNASVDVGDTSAVGDLNAYGEVVSPDISAGSTSVFSGTASVADTSTTPADTATATPGTSATSDPTSTTTAGTTEAAAATSTDATATTAAGTGTTFGDTSTTAAETATAPADTGTAPADTGTTPADTGTAPAGTSTTPADTSAPPAGTDTDAGAVSPTGTVGGGVAATGGTSLAG